MDNKPKKSLGEILDEVYHPLKLKSVAVEGSSTPTIISFVVIWAMVGAVAALFMNWGG